MPRVPFSHRIEEEVKEAFDDLDDILPGDKGEWVAAALRAFMAMPENIQHKLLSGKPENRKICLDVLASLEVPLKVKKAARQDKSSKSA